MSVNRAICPDIYHPAVARDGLLTRLRIPGGILNVAQCRAIVELLASIGLEDVSVTNRANLQFRALTEDLDRSLLPNLVACGLVAVDPRVDGIRNMMASPIAGIDPQESIDVRPYIAAWDKYLSAHPELGVLSNKFSVGFDGGGSVSILDRPNDIALLAISEHEFLLHLAMGERGDAPVNVGVRFDVHECLPILGAIAQSYRRGIEESGTDPQRKPRLRDVIERWWGLDAFLTVVREEIDLLCLGINLTRMNAPMVISPEFGNTRSHLCQHLGIWPQKWAGLSYVGVALPLGKMTAVQLSGLAKIAEQYGSGKIRLTPWQNAIVPDVRDEDVEIVLRSLARLGLGIAANAVNGLLTACAGAKGCQFAAGDTQADALALSAALMAQGQLDRPLNVHFSGCEKSCAQHYPADIALWGCPQTAERAAGYRLCLGGGDDKFGRELRDYLTPEDVRLAIDRLIRAYRERRLSPEESFRAFADRQSLAQLQQVLHAI